MDLESFSPLWSDDAVALDLRGPDGRVVKGDDGKPVRLFLLPPDSRKLTARRDDIRREHREAHPDGATPTDDAVRLYVAKSLAAALTGWSDNFTVGGERLTYSEDRAHELIDRVPLVKEQVASWLGDRGKAWAVLSKRAAVGASGEAASTEPKAADEAGGKN